jgi:atypical dual specificity phosphatase
MDWITPDIAIGSYYDAQNADLIRENGIRSILGLIATLQGKDPADLGVQRINIITLLDGPGNELTRFIRAINMLESLVVEAPPVLVHCRAGWSRSPAVVAGYLMRSTGVSADEALGQVAAKRTFTMVPDLRNLLNQLDCERGQTKL